MAVLTNCIALSIALPPAFLWNVRPGFRPEHCDFDPLIHEYLLLTKV
jgi:hypothetical protein